VVASEILAVQKFWHALAGLFIWEFVTTLDYEWSVIQGHRRYRWTIWIYSVTRLATLMTVILNLVTLDITAPTNCQVLSTFSFFFAYTTFALSSLLIVLRIIAIWNKHKAIVGLATVLWVTNVSLLILGIARIRAVWVPENSSCSVPNIESGKPNVVSVLVTDIVLLLVMLVGLLRLRRRGGGMFALGHLLWKQGVIWLLLATVAEVPPTMFVFLNLNDPLNVMFLMPSLIIMSIAATRMYRSLVDFVSSSDITKDSERHQRIGHNRTSAPTISISPNRMEVAVHTPYERDSTSQIGRNTSDLSMGDSGQLLEKPHVVDEGLESNVGNR